MAREAVLMLGYTFEMEWRDAHGSTRQVGFWHADVHGLDWLHDLVSAGLAARQGDGYPFLFRVRARDAISILCSGPPGMMHFPTASIPLASLSQISADDWLDVKAWDQS